MLTKRKIYIKNLTDVRFFIKLNQLKLPNLGRLDNIERICNSDLCWQEKIEWAKRISGYRGSRQETFEYYSIIYNCEKEAEKKMKEKSDRMVGEKNPWYKHGGKYSPLKEGSVNYNPYIIKHIHDNLKAKGNYTTKIEYYLNKGYSEKEAEKMLSERQAVGRLDKFIERYGEEEGYRRWQERQIKWMKSMPKTPYSRISQELFQSISERIDCSDVYYATFEREDMKYYQNKEYHLKTRRSFIKPDFIDVGKKKIIEFDGDYWHSDKIANPRREKERDDEIMWLGYGLFRVKESGYKQNKKGVIEECINFLME